MTHTSPTRKRGSDAVNTSPTQARRSNASDMVIGRTGIVHGPWMSAVQPLHDAGGTGPGWQFGIACTDAPETLAREVESPRLRVGLVWPTGVPRWYENDRVNTRRWNVNRPNELPMPDPLAYYLTWTTYGTWLPGDERGWVKFGRGQQQPDSIRKIEAEARMTEDACRLDQEHARWSRRRSSIIAASVGGNCLRRTAARTTSTWSWRLTSSRRRCASNSKHGVRES